VVGASAGDRAADAAADGWQAAQRPLIAGQAPRIRSHRVGVGQDHPSGVPLDLDAGAELSEAADRAGDAVD
jgi:hypothetical protein